MTTPPRAMLAPTAFSAGDPLINLATGKVDTAVLETMKQFDYAISYTPPIKRLGWSALDLLSTHGVKIVGKVTLDHAWEEKDTSCLQGALYVEALGKGAVTKGGGAINVQKFGPADLVARIRYHLITYPPVPIVGIHIEAHGEGCEELRARLHDAIPLEMPLYWNNGAPELREWASRPRRGLMFEGYPFQQVIPGNKSGAFTTLLDRRRKGCDTEPIIFTAALSGGFDNPLNVRKYLYGMTSAFMFDALHIFAAPEPNALPWWTWEFPVIDFGAPRGDLREEFQGWIREGEKLTGIADPPFPETQGSPPARGRAWVVAR